MHVYTWLAHLDIRIDQNTPFFNKRLKKFSGPIPSGEGDTPSPHPAPSTPSAPRGPPNEMSGSATVGEDTHQSSASPRNVFDFRYFASFRHQSALKAIRGENRCQILDFFTPSPLKIKGGIGEMFEWIFIFFMSNLAANILYILAGWRCAGWESGGNGWVMVLKNSGWLSSRVYCTL